MHTVKIAIIEENMDFAERIREKVVRWISSRICCEKVAVFYTGLQLQEALDLGEVFNLFFLGIDLLDKNGLDLAKEIRQRDKSCILFFITHRDQAVYDAVDLGIAGFVRKSEFETKLDKKLQSLLPKVEAVSQVVRLKCRVEEEYEERLLLVRDISAFFLEDRHLKAALEKENILLSGRSFEDMPFKVEEKGFFRINRTVVVNMRSIVQVNKEGHVILKNSAIEQSLLWVSRRRLSHLNTYRMKLLSEEEKGGEREI